jgi:sugar fermentation stimulation protein A
MLAACDPTPPGSASDARPTPELVRAHFLTRLNRFAALVDLGGQETMVHVANSGRMRELLVVGNLCWLRAAHGEHRKTAYDLALVDIGHTLVSADARLPNHLVHRAFREGRLPQFADYYECHSEVTYGESRLDLALSGVAGACFVETKSVTLIEDGAALFPDAPTTRGRKHVFSLMHAVAEGYRAAVIFVIQRDDARSFRPHDVADPEFGQALRQAVDAGVEAYAYTCTVSLEEVRLADPVEVRL